MVLLVGVVPMNQSIMLTGGKGFIGSHTLLALCSSFKDKQIINVDAETYAARPPLYLHRPPNMVEEKCDIRDQLAVNRLMRKYKPAHIVHMAAESHVCRSIAGPKDFVTTNILGTFNLLEEFRDVSGGRFVHISTDEVFGEIAEGHFSEDSPVLPRNPYAASKASSDLLVRAYHQTYGMQTITLRMANNFGPNQHLEKLVPRTITHIMEQKPVIVHGTGSNRREWLYVKDAANGIVHALCNGKPGRTYCLPGEIELSNLEMIRMIHKAILHVTPANGYKLELQYTNDRPTDDRRYAMKGDLARQELGWEPKKSFEVKLRSTVQWYLGAMMHRGRRALHGWGV